MSERKMLTVLAIDNPAGEFDLIRQSLENEHTIPIHLLRSPTIETARHLLKTESIDCVLLDPVLNMESELDSGLGLLRELRSTGNDIPVIALTSMGNEEIAVATLKAGAQDYLTKNQLSRERLVQAIRNAIHQVDLAREVRRQQRELSELASQLKVMNEELKSLTRIDALTQISNRRHFNEALERETRRNCRQGPLSLVLVDVDCFKLFNDYYGHQKGDVCLQEVARALSRCARRSGDIVARYGGEEFALILPATDHAGALQRAELVREEVGKLKIPHARSTVSPYVTVSAGVATGTSQNPEEDEILRRADQALYQAKLQGRDCVVSAEEMTVE